MQVGRSSGKAKTNQEIVAINDPVASRGACIPKGNHSKHSQLPQGSDVPFKLRHVVMEGNAPAGQQVLERDGTHCSELGGLHQGQAVALEQQHRQFLLEFRRRQMRGVKGFIGYRDSHDCGLGLINAKIYLLFGFPQCYHFLTS